MRPLLLTLALLALATPLLRAQGTRADYDRAATLEQFARAKVKGGKIRPHWAPDNESFWYRDERTGQRWQFDVATSNLHEIPAAPSTDAAANSLPPLRRPHPSFRTGESTALTIINHTPGDILIKWINPEGEPVSYGTLAAGETTVEHTYGGHVWLITDRADKRLAVFEATDDEATAVVGPDTPASPAKPSSSSPATPAAHSGTESPDHRWFAFLKDGNVLLYDATTKQETALAHDAKPGDAFDDDFYWSPDSRRLVAKRTEAAQEHKIYLVESSPKDQVQPKLHPEPYLKPGDRIAHSRPHLFNVSEAKEIPVADTLFPNPWDLDEFRWSPDSKQFSFTYNQRGHQVLRVVGVDAETGEAKALVDDQSKTFIDYSGKRFQRYLDGSNELFWMSERDGWNHLYLHDATTGALKSQITRGPWVVRKVDRIDETTRQIWFQAGGIRPEQNPYYVHYCRVNFDGTGLTILTAGDGDHTVDWSPDKKYFFDTWSRVNQPPITELRRADDGGLVCELAHGDWSELLKNGWSAPEPFSAKGRDGTTDIYGVIFRPMNFDPARKYPVIENIYAGPQGSFVPRGFQPVYGSQKLAELGFIVVQIDGMGTSDRSKAFHDVCWKNLQDAGLPDRILWMQAAAVKYPALDLSHVGVYGTSAGGQSALGALLFHGDFYKAAVADCGCHDNRMDKIWWNEQWMGWPVGPEYAEASNVTHATQLTGKLLLVVGEMDRNVDPSSTMQVVNALIKADKDFDLLVVPGAGHGATGSPYGERRRNDFLVRSLLSVEPRSR